MRKLRSAVLVAGLVLGLAVLGVAPAGASTGGNGDVSFVLTANLPSFPCPPPGCHGTFGGTSEGTFAGLNGNMPWTVTWLLGNMSGSYSYADSCLIPVGIAAGSGNLAAGVGSVIGTYGPATGSTSLPFPVVGLNVPFTFQWSRIGNTAIITGSVTLQLQVLFSPTNVQWITVVSNGLTVAASAFAPTGPISMCGASAPLSAVVVGSAAVDS